MTQYLSNMLVFVEYVLFMCLVFAVYSGGEGVQFLLRL